MPSRKKKKNNSGLRDSGKGVTLGRWVDAGSFEVWRQKDKERKRRRNNKRRKVESAVKHRTSRRRNGRTEG